MLGTVVLARPVSVSIITSFLSTIVCAALGVVSLGTYARKETVSGYLVPDTGIARVHAPASGVIGDIYVREGQRVASGAPVLSILSDTRTGGGIAVDGEMLNVIGRKVAEVRSQLRREGLRNRSEEKRLRDELTSLQSERAAIDEQLTIQRFLIANLQENHDRFTAMARDGYVSQTDFIARQEKLLNSRQLLAGLRQKQAAVTTLITRIAGAIEQLPVESGERLSRLKLNLADLRLREIELSGQRSITLTAPVSGTITGLQVVAGTSVDPRITLLHVVPAGGTLQAQLFVPTRAIGFVEVGHEVRLMYEAFDYRQFGIQKGRVVSISSVVFNGYNAESSMQIPEPSYRVTVSLDQQDVHAHGKRIPLQAGMLLSADVILERRRLLQWLLAPLFSLQGRT